MKKEKIVIADPNAEWKNSVGWQNLNTEERITLLEKEGKFDIDSSDDPPTFELKPEEIDYLRKKWINKLKTKLANKVASNYIEKLIKQGNLVIKEINGLEHFEGLNSGALITCNHFNPFDNFAIQKVFEKVQKPKQKMWKIIREGNYTNPPCLPFFFKNCDTLPLSENKHTMMKFLQALKTVLTRGDYVLIYPEESLWWNYKKPKPLKNGAFNLAVRNNSPVIPIFITIKDVAHKDDSFAMVQEYYVHILEPIYPDKNLSKQENIKQMKQRNYNAWVEVYEKFYGEKLTYLCDKNN